MKLIEQIAAKVSSMDKTITYTIVLLMLFSIALIYSATGKLAVMKENGNNINILIKHCSYLLLSFGALVTMRIVNYIHLKKYAAIILFVAYFLMGYAMFSEIEINGTSRWIKIPFIGMTFQASEFAKIAIIIMTAKIISIYQLEDYCYEGVIKPFFICCVPLILFVFWDDFSTAALMTISCAVMFIVGRLQWRVIAKWFLMFMVVLLISGVAVVKIPQMGNIARVATIKARIERFYSDEPKDVKGKDNQEIRSLLALANGGLIGTGPGNSVQRNYLPHPYSDFIYAIIIEEYGIVFGLLVMLCYLTILLRVGVIIRRCKRVFPALLIAGLGTLFTLQALAHIAVSVGAIPITGQTLPFISWGGSSLLFMGILIGMILSVAATFTPEVVKDRDMDYYDTLSNDYAGEYTNDDDEGYDARDGSVSESSLPRSKNNDESVHDY